MESQPQKPEFRNNPENFHPCGPWGQWPYFAPNGPLAKARVIHFTFCEWGNIEVFYFFFSKIK